jgi:hypothetical protein
MRLKFKYKTSIRVTTIILIVLFLVLATSLFLLKEDILSAHNDARIDYIASDASVYWKVYENFYSTINLFDLETLYFLNTSPVFLLKIFDGNILIVLIINLLLMLVSLKVALNCLEDRDSRILFIIGTFLFPYFLVGFLSLNKEIYAMSSGIFFASYYLRGKKSHLIMALILAFLARYYMFLAIIFAALVFPRNVKPRYWLAFTTLLFISLAEPFVKKAIPTYSGESLFEGSESTVGLFFSAVIDSYGYALVYPIKYIVLVLARLWTFVIGQGRLFDIIVAVVSLMSLLLILATLYIIVCKKRLSPQVSGLIMMAFITPIPIMWSEIMHWRYYSFVYFFLLFAVVMHLADRRRMRKLLLRS